VFLDLRIVKELRVHFSEVRILEELAFLVSRDVRSSPTLPGHLCDCVTNRVVGKGVCKAMKTLDVRFVGARVNAKKACLGVAVLQDTQQRIPLKLALVKHYLYSNHSNDWVEVSARKD
jgi:hypothetical protein